MSFIYQDPNLLDKLIKSAQDFEQKFNKQAQLNQAYQNYLTLTDKLVDNLRNDLLKPATNALSANTDAQLNVPDLSNLGNFFTYTVKNGIKINNQPIVIPANETNPDPNTYWPISTHESKPLMESSDAQGNRKDITADYWVNKALLTEYIQTINEKVSKLAPEAQRLAKTMLNGIVQKINASLNTNLTNEYKEKAPQVAETQVVDALPQTMSITNWRQSGNIVLTLANVKTPQSLNDWLETKGIGVQDAKGIVENIQGLGGRDFICNVVKILHSRAAARLAGATTNSKAYAEEFLKRITQIASEIKCDVSSPLSGSSQHSTTGNNNQAGQTGGATFESSLQQLTAMRPFNSQRIDFEGIRLFANSYAALANDENVNVLVKRVNDEVEACKSLLGNSSAPLIVDNLSPSSVSDLTSQPLVLVNDLLSLIQDSGRLYANFYQTYRNKLENWAEQKHWDWAEGAVRAMEQQITSGGPQQTNLSNLSQVKQLLMDKLQRHR